MSDADGGDSEGGQTIVFGGKETVLPKGLIWDAQRHARKVSGKFHPETGGFLDDLPLGVGRPYLENDEDD